jgi:hypothetical protein
VKPETIFRKRVLAFLKTLPHTFFDPIQQMSISGSPDYYVCTRGHFIALEIKTDEGIVDDLQEWLHNEVVKKGGGIALVCRPSNFKQIKSKLMALAKGKSINDQDNVSVHF